MESKGVITGINGKEIKIRLYKETACDHCNSCSGESKFAREYTLTTDRQVTLGDTITLEVAGETVIKASLIFYAFPIIFLFLGYYVGNKALGYSENISIGIGFGFLIFSFFCVAAYDRIFRKRTLDNDIKITSIEKSSTEYLGNSD